MADRTLSPEPIYQAYAQAGEPGYGALPETIRRNQVSLPGPFYIRYPQGVRSGTEEGGHFRMEPNVAKPGGDVAESDLLLAMNRLLGAAPARGTVPVAPRPATVMETLKAAIGLAPEATPNPNIVPVVASNAAARRAAMMYEMAGGDKAPKNEVMEKMLRFFTEAYGAPNSAQ